MTTTTYLHARRDRTAHRVNAKALYIVDVHQSTVASVVHATPVIATLHVRALDAESALDKANEARVGYGVGEYYVRMLGNDEADATITA